MMHALKNPSFFRPASRPTSPSPSPPSPPRSEGTGSDRTLRPLNKLSFNTFRRPPTTVISRSPSAPALLVQDGSYLGALSLKLSEAVSRALAQPTGPAGVNEQVNGKRPIPPGRGQALGALIASELQATRGNPHLHKTIIRFLHRPLSVLLSNLSAYVLPLLASPAFLLPPSVHVPNPNPTQLHALALALVAGELITSFDEMGLGLDGDARVDGLKAIREGLASVIGRVVNPLIAGLKNELTPTIDAIEFPVSSTVQKTTTSGKLGPALHPSVVNLQSLLPIYSRALARYIVPLPSQANLATFLLSVVWRALVALSNRPLVLPSPPNSPAGSPAISTAMVLKRRAPSSSASTPSATPPASRFSLKLPPSRPSSPPATTSHSTLVADARALYDLLNLLPRPPADTEATRLAREAVDEAFDDLKALVGLLESVSNPFFRLNKTEEELSDEIDNLTADLPTLIALPVLLHGHLFSSGVGPSKDPSIPSMLRITEDEYKKGCLAGFGRAEECASVVGQRVLSVITSENDVHPCVVKWLEARLASGEP